MKDIDETILNSCPYQPHQLLPGKNYDPVIKSGQQKEKQIFSPVH